MQLVSKIGIVLIAFSVYHSSAAQSKKTITQQLFELEVLDSQLYTQLDSLVNRAHKSSWYDSSWVWILGKVVVSNQDSRLLSNKDSFSFVISTGNVEFFAAHKQWGFFYLDGVLFLVPKNSEKVPFLKQTEEKKEFSWVKYSTDHDEIFPVWMYRYHCSKAYFIYSNM